MSTKGSWIALINGTANVAQTNSYVQYNERILVKARAVTGFVIVGVVWGALLVVCFAGCDAGVARTASSSAEQTTRVPETWRVLPNLSTEAGSPVVDLRNHLREWAPPEPEAEELLQMLEHLPAQPPVVAAISSPYGWRKDPLDPRGQREQFHNGVDFAVPEGTPVRAPAPGVIMSVQQGGGYGRYLRIKHAEVGLVTILAHLSEVQTGIEASTEVQRGQVVAYSGGGSQEDGRSTGPHVHLEIQVLARGSRRHEAVDPALVFDLYWETWDAVQAFPVARGHAAYGPYTLAMQ